jgi:hypothetical protein
MRCDAREICQNVSTRLDRLIRVAKLVAARRAMPVVGKVGRVERAQLCVRVLYSLAFKPSVSHDQQHRLSPLVVLLQQQDISSWVLLSWRRR